VTGDVKAAYQALTDARALNQAAGNAAAALSSSCSLGHLYVLQGQFHRAAALFRPILDDANRQGSGALPVVGIAYGGMGEVLYEWYELAAAEEHLLKAIELGKQWGFAGNLIHHYISMALVKQAQGDGEQALRVLDELEQLLPQDTHRSLSSSLRTFRVLLEVAQGQMETASRWAEEYSFLLDRASTSQDDFERLTLARVYIAQGRYEEARQVLKSLLLAEDKQESGSRRRSVIESLVLLAVAQQKQGHIDEARDTLAQALALAEPEGYARTFVNEGNAVAVLLTEVLSAQRQGKLAPSRQVSPVYAGRLLRLLEGETRPEPVGARDSGGAQPLVEPLSEREREVLQRVAAGVSNRELAEEFVVSVGTIKTHLNNIYGKLNVHSRTQAIARARELHLLQ
jgi:LuxR family maltose regulon positive regulatory protein